MGSWPGREGMFEFARALRWAVAGVGVVVLRAELAFPPPVVAGEGLCEGLIVGGRHAECSEQP